jgi:hypothetical protein
MNYGSLDISLLHHYRTYSDCEAAYICSLNQPAQELLPNSTQHPVFFFAFFLLCR